MVLDSLAIIFLFGVHSLTNLQSDRGGTNRILALVCLRAKVDSGQSWARKIGGQMELRLVYAIAQPVFLFGCLCTWPSYTCPQ
jgi:hypothetical protein